MTKRKRRKKLPIYLIYLHDEAPRIGCGWRRINILSAGHKWVRIKEVATDRAARLPVKAWLAIDGGLAP